MVISVLGAPGLLSPVCVSGASFPWQVLGWLPQGCLTLTESVIPTEVRKLPDNEKLSFVPESTGFLVASSVTDPVLLVAHCVAVITLGGKFKKKQNKPCFLATSSLSGSSGCLGDHTWLTPRC